MYPYGTTQSSKNPAPEIEIAVSAPGRREMGIKVVCIVDTGASISVIPSAVVRRLGPLDYDVRYVGYYNGHPPQEVNRYILDLMVEGFFFHGCHVITTEKHYGLIGRDLLNSYQLTCDGPKRIWITDPRWK